jgi:hypothetical protein
MTQPRRKSFWSRLFGGNAVEPTGNSNASNTRSGPSPGSRSAKIADHASLAEDEQAGAKSRLAADPQARSVDDPKSIQDYRYLLDQPPEPDDLAGLNKRVRQIADVSATQRKNGDNLVKGGIATQEAKSNWELALQLNDKSIEVVKRYKDFELMFKEDGRPLPGASKSNYPLEGGEQALARQFCDLLGRQGGLLRRLGRQKEAYKYYAIGAEIEANGANFGVVNSYCTMNAIAIQIELGDRRASPSTYPPADLSKEINAARRMIEKQFAEGRKKDMWAKADLGMAIVLSGSSENNRADAEEQYYEFAVGSFPDDFDTTVRVLRLVEKQLGVMNDPVAEMVTWAIGHLQEVRQKKLGQLRRG